MAETKNASGTKKDYDFNLFQSIPEYVGIPAISGKFIQKPIEGQLPGNDLELRKIEDIENTITTKTTDFTNKLTGIDKLNKELYKLNEKIEKYKIPEKVYHITKKEKISSELLISKYLKGDSLKVVSKLNNKIIIQDDDTYNLFSLKSVYDAERFLINLEKYMIENHKTNCLIVKDSSIQQKKYLYEVLSNLGYNKDMLYRTSTTHLKDK